jgi:hypothetical protein
VAGWGQEPFFQGILAWAFDLAGRAMSCTGTDQPAGCDSPTSTLAYQYNSDAVNWLMTTSYDPASYGFYYYVGYPGCNPATHTNLTCTRGYTGIGARELFGDAFRGFLVYYQRTGDAVAKAMVDTIYSGLWGKPGTNPIVPSPDGTYDTQFDTCQGCGFWLMTGATQNKLFGQMFGLSRQDNWPVVRIGGVLPPHVATLYVGGKISAVPGATAMQVTVTDPTGIASAPVTCTSSPCAVTVDRTMGNPTIEVNYLSATGAVLSSGTPFLATVR